MSIPQTMYACLKSNTPSKSLSYKAVTQSTSELARMLNANAPEQIITRQLFIEAQAAMQQRKTMLTVHRFVPIQLHQWLTH